MVVLGFIFTLLLIAEIKADSDNGRISCTKNKDCDSNKFKCRYDPECIINNIDNGYGWKGSNGWKGSKSAQCDKVCFEVSHPETICGGNDPDAVCSKPFRCIGNDDVNGIAGICVNYQYEPYDGYCTPDLSQCWPTNFETETELNSKLSPGAQLFIYDDIIDDVNDYDEYIQFHNGTNQRTNEFPAFVVVVDDVTDIQTAVLFASCHNIQISIFSTGHSFSGRSTGNNTLQINLSQMKNYQFNGNNIDSITTETGLTYIEIYGIVQSVDRMIVGGSGHGVGPGGYSAGGGHSPLSATYGLAVDWVKEFYLVDATGSIVHVFDDPDDEEIADLFWALRGGGASTFGVIVNVTFDLIVAPETVDPNYKYNYFVCGYSWYDLTTFEVIADDIINNYFDYITNGGLSTNWNGYFIVGKDDQFSDYILFAMLYPGDTSAAYVNILPIMNYRPDSQLYCFFIPYPNFYSYILGVESLGYQRFFIYSDLIEKDQLNNDYTNTILQTLSKNSQYDQYGIRQIYLSAFIHGAVQNYNADSSAINPAFRDSVFVATCTVYWEDEAVDDLAINWGKESELNFKQFSNAKYSNEENAICPECDWKAEFWGNSTYRRLEPIKNKWDPNNVFFCNHCVGSDQL